jgi:predicted adenylyl cyclase CyaB
MSGDGDRRSNIELKARCPDRKFVREALRTLGAEDCGVEQQIDSYFSTGAYRMKLRESSSGNHTLIWYSRPNTSGSRKSTYRLQSIPDPRTKRRILSQAMGIKQVVTKDRHLFRIGPTRIHLDSVDELGSYLEFEVVLGDDVTESQGHEIIADLRLHLNVRDEDLVSRSYADLVGDALPA